MKILVLLLDQSYLAFFNDPLKLAMLQVIELAATTD